MNKEKQDRQAILDQVAAYYKNHKAGKDDFKPGMRIPYAARVFDEKEMMALAEADLDFWLSTGDKTEAFEAALSEYLGIKHVSFVNSGSSANLLAFGALCSPLLKDRRIKPGDEVITVAAGFATTVTPIIQNGAVPVFVDVTLPEYNVNVGALEAAITPKTKAVFFAHSLGLPFDVAKVKTICDKHNLWLIEDNCDSLGATAEVNGVKYKTGTIGDIGTSSFYPPHHMTTGEGGAVYTNNPLLNKIIVSLKDWGRDCTCKSGQDNKCGHRFSKQYGELPLGYDHKYVFSHFGYNLKATDMQAAIGIEQVKKLPGFVKARQGNYAKMWAGLKDLQDKLMLPKATDGTTPSPFGFPITIAKNAGFTRQQITEYLEARNIQSRTLFAGNITLHPCFDELRQSKKGYRMVGDFENTERIMNDTFWVGVYPGLTPAQVDYMIDSIREYTKQNG